MPSKKLITGELEFSPKRIHPDALGFMGSMLYLLSCTCRKVTSLCCWRHPEDNASAVSKCEKFLLPTPALEVPVTCCIQRYHQGTGCL